ncbi:hypothetical protein N8I77_006143 [Diaporthe amygdali]|uniref:DASH complex subunit DAD3 n=2 Tax=Phomopsis amygdali TaxID=1214568 RepID=A0AAD9SGQ9_PHOAM|nr:hypothetical protein N8I77_006143 [Diaporthe amygdali]
MSTSGAESGVRQQPHVEISTTIDAFLTSTTRRLDSPQPTIVCTPTLARRMDDRPASSALLSPPELSPLEQEVLDEYERLADNMKNLAAILDNMAAQPTTEILDGLRELERKTSLVFTLLKASVYSIVLQQEIDWGDQAQQ